MTTARHASRIQFLCFLLLLVVCLWLSRQFHLDTDTIQLPLSRLPLLQAGVLFVCLYVAVTFFIWFSKDIFRVAAALIFGPYISTLLVWVAETLNAAILFYCARFMGREFVVEGGLPVSRRLDEHIAGLNFFWLFLFRVAPLVPFRFLDLAAGLTRISFRRYGASVILGSLPRIFWLQFILAGVGKSVFGDFGQLVAYFSTNSFFLFFNLAYVLLVVMVAFKLQSEVRK